MVKPHPYLAKYKPHFMITIIGQSNFNLSNNILRFEIMYLNSTDINYDYIEDFSNKKYTYHFQTFK